MFDTQQGDVNLFQTDDEGDIRIESGIVEMVGGLGTTVYLSLFGGNDDGLDWWANISEPVDSRTYTSETQKLLNELPPSSGNLRRIEDAATEDTKWMLADNVASEITVEASIPAIGRVKLVVEVEAVGSESSFEFTENWKAKK